MCKNGGECGIKLKYASGTKNTSSTKNSEFKFRRMTTDGSYLYITDSSGKIHQYKLKLNENSAHEHIASWTQRNAFHITCDDQALYIGERPWTGGSSFKHKIVKIPFTTNE